MHDNSKKLIKYQDLDNLDYSTVKKLYKKHINNTRTDLLSCFGSGRVLVKKALGSKIYLLNKKIILDATGGFGVLNHGHNHPRILKSRMYCLQNQTMEVNKSFLSPALAALSSNLATLLPKKLNYSFFPNSGSEAIDVALRLALKFFNGRRDIFLASDIAFHGKSIGPQSISRSGENPFKLDTAIKCHHFAYNSISSFDQLIKKNIKPNGESKIAAVIIEPFSASTITEATDKFLNHIFNVCNEQKILLIFDEVYSGFFKTGTFFNFLRLKNISPDILCFAKSLGGGKSSIAGVAYSDKLNDKTLSGINSANYLSSTYYGFFEETVTALESIQIAIDEDYESKAEIFHDYMSELSKDINNKFPNKFILKGKGLLWGLFIHESNLPIGFSKSNFAKKIIYSSIINWLFEKKQILTALGFGYNPHIIISLNFAYSKNDLEKLKNAIYQVCEENPIKLIPRFMKNMLWK